MSPPVIGHFAPAGLPDCCAVRLRRSPGWRDFSDAAAARGRRCRRHPAGTAGSDVPEQQRALAGKGASAISSYWPARQYNAAFLHTQHCPGLVEKPEFPSQSLQPGCLLVSTCRPSQSTPLAQPAASEEFTPEELQYWEGTVLGAAWPALIGLGIAAGALLLFLLW